MYYATYKNLGDTDIAEFKTKKERDDWVNFKDEYSIDCELTPDNCIFERQAISLSKAKVRIPFMEKMIYEGFPNIVWYLEGKLWI